MKHRCQLHTLRFTLRTPQSTLYTPQSRFLSGPMITDQELTSPKPNVGIRERSWIERVGSGEMATKGLTSEERIAAIHAPWEKPMIPYHHQLESTGSSRSIQLTSNGGLLIMKL